VTSADSECAPEAAPPSDPVVTAAEELDAMADLPLDEQPDAYQRIHGRLQDALAAIDDA
jgi:hypothetical protein